MKLDRLFNVLVLGGAAVGLAACSGEGGGGSSEGAGGVGSGGAGGNATGSSTSGDMSTSSATGGEGGAGGGGTGGAGGSGTGGVGGSGMLECSAMADPADPCGCPCCWVTDCLNTELCCIDFCKEGNGGLGCCGG
jgi:hypothetical protein